MILNYAIILICQVSFNMACPWMIQFFVSFFLAYFRVVAFSLFLWSRRRGKYFRMRRRVCQEHVVVTFWRLVYDLRFDFTRAEKQTLSSLPRMMTEYADINLPAEETFAYIFMYILSPYC